MYLLFCTSFRIDRKPHIVDPIIGRSKRSDDHRGSTSRRPKPSGPSTTDKRETAFVEHATQTDRAVLTLPFPVSIRIVLLAPRSRSFSLAFLFFLQCLLFTFTVYVFHPNWTTANPKWNAAHRPRLYIQRRYDPNSDRRAERGVTYPEYRVRNTILY